MQEEKTSRVSTTEPRRMREADFWVDSNRVLRSKFSDATIDYPISDHPMTMIRMIFPDYMTSIEACEEVERIVQEPNAASYFSDVAIRVLLEKAIEAIDALRAGNPESSGMAEDAYNGAREWMVHEALERDRGADDEFEVDDIGAGVPPKVAVLADDWFSKIDDEFPFRIRGQ